MASPQGSFLGPNTGCGRVLSNVVQRSWHISSLDSKCFSMSHCLSYHDIGLLSHRGEDLG